jgi:MFS family permease
MSYNEITLFYVISQILAIPLPILGSYLGKRINYKNTIILSILTASIGLALLQFSHNLLTALSTYFIYQLILLSLPNYYVYLSSIGSGAISVTWAYSILPSIVSPYIGGIIVEKFGFNVLFLISSIILASAAIPIFFINTRIINDKKDQGLKISRIVISLLSIIPISIVSPIIYLFIYEKYNLEYSIVGFLSTIAELVGMSILLISYKIKKSKEFLIVSFSIYSLVYFSLISPYAVIFFGMWESIIPLSLEETLKGLKVKQISVVNSFQSIGWLLGYLISYYINNPILSIEIASIISTIMVFILLIVKNILI